ncbi:hypothetical protein MCOR02_009202 [Pyricularia oryzae]|nr:hypothetical protein MCOR02_009202 [Pyricularia oryzae]KAI6617100.1 hypothetical protein MCOR14_010867 [Pyricularia oryzae]
MAPLTDPEKRDRQQKELVRKRGGSLMRKAEQLGRLGEIFVFTVFYDPLYGYDGIVNIPEGFKEPNIKKMRPKEPQEQRQEAVLDEITVEPNDGSCVHEDDGDSSIGETGNQEANEPQAYSNGTSEIDAPHEVDADFETLFGQKNICNDLKEANFQLIRKQPSIVVKRIVGIRLKDGRFIRKRIFKVRIPRVRIGG